MTTRLQLIVLGVALVCIIAVVGRADEAEDKAVAALEAKWKKCIQGRDEKSPGKPVIGINLFGSKLNDADLKMLAPIKGLQWLEIGENEKLTDEALKELVGFKSLRWLHAFRVPVTNDGLKDIAKLNALQDLALGMTKVSDGGMKELTALKELKKLDLRDTSITDVGLKEIGKISGLQSLSLYSTKVSDAGLKELTSLKDLKLLEIGRTEVTEKGAKEMNKVLPNCIIRRAVN